MTTTLEPIIQPSMDEVDAVAPEPVRPARAAPDLAKRLQLLLRLSMAGTYIGHGAFGIIGKEAWLSYTGLFGFTDSQGWALQPFIGAMDISFGILMLVWPTRAVMLHLSVWGLVTATFRPLAGEGLWEEVFERGGNYGMPMALLVLTGWGGDSIKAWVSRVNEAPVLTVSKAVAMHWILRIATALLLIGHGGFGLFMHKPVWLGYAAQVGIDAQSFADMNLHMVVGTFEILFGFAVLARPLRPLLIAACAYKIGTELLRPAAGEPWWEFIERAGSYLAPVALIMVDTWLHQHRRASEPALAHLSPDSGR
jgi:hypothetical protein